VTAGAKRRARGFVAGLMLAFIIGGARASVVVDDTGQRLTLSHYPQRIISLAPGATEMLFAAGAGSRVIATVQYSDEPTAARAVPRIGDVVAIDLERLVALHPEVVVVWPGGGNPAQIEEIARLGMAVYRQQVNTLADLAPSVRRLGALAGTGPVAETAAAALEGQLARLLHDYGAGVPRTVLLQVWDHPIYTVGGSQLMSDVLRVCGARNVFGDLTALAPAVDIEAVVARDPDIIVAAAPPGSGPQWVAGWRRYTSLRAVRTGRVIPFEDQRLTRLGPSVLDAAESLCKLLAATG